MSLHLQPVDFSEACAFIRRYHRHHVPPQNCRVCIGANDGTRIVGVATMGRPVARMLDDGSTIEVTRLCTDGTRNAASFLYGACRRVAFGLGYARVISYTLPEEGGASLRAAGWSLALLSKGGSWSRPSRPRLDKHPLGPKWRWEAINPEFAGRFRYGDQAGIQMQLFGGEEG